MNKRSFLKKLLLGLAAAFSFRFKGISSFDEPVEPVITAVIEPEFRCSGPLKFYNDLRNSVINQDREAWSKACQEHKVFERPFPV